ncbi:MAG: asparaginase domain-containing protein [Pyrinomonadaceae bacterium]
MEQTKTGSSNGRDLRIAFLTTGGSIDKTYSPHTSTFEIEDSMIADILDDGEVRFTPHISSIFKKDSLEMTDADRHEIRKAVEKCGHERIIITHGTDTIVKTGQFLEGIPDKVIVLTGAFRPIRLRHTDAVLNLGMAIAAVQTLPCGVYVAINGTVSPVHGTKKDLKNQTFQFQPSHLNLNGKLPSVVQRRVSKAG